MQFSPEHKRIKVIVNNREMEVYDGITILQALIQEGLHIPHLCYDLRLERSNGNCGLCVVELGAEGREPLAEAIGRLENLGFWDRLRGLWSPR